MKDDEIVFYALRSITRKEILEWAMKELLEEEKEKLRSNLNNDADELIAKISNSYFEPGKETGAHKFFNELIDKDKNYAFEVMMKALQKEALNPNVINGIMYILSQIPYNIANPSGITIALGCIGMATITTEAKERFISCFDALWDECPSAIYILENLKLNDEESWLREYRDAVLKDLKERKNNNETEN